MPALPAGGCALIALIEESAMTQRIYRHLGLPTEVLEARSAPPLLDNAA